MVTWLLSHPLDESQEVLLLLQLLTLYTSASLCWPFCNSGSRCSFPRVSCWTSPGRGDAAGQGRSTLFWPVMP